MCQVNVEIWKKRNGSQNNVVIFQIQPILIINIVQSTSQGGGGGGRGTLIFSYIHRLGSFLGFKIVNFNIFGVFQKMSIFWGMKILWIYFFFFWGGGGIITKLDYI